MKANIRTYTGQQLLDLLNTLSPEDLEKPVHTYGPDKKGSPLQSVMVGLTLQLCGYTPKIKPL